MSTVNFSRSFRRVRYPFATRSALVLCLGATLASCGGGGSSSSSTSPVVNLTASKTRVNPGESITLFWTSRNVTSVVSSNFGAAEASGSATVGPLSATTDYTLTCTGPNGSASDHVTVVVNSGGDITAIPKGVLLYSVDNPGGGSTLYYLNAAGGDPVSVGTYAANVTVLGTNAAGNRLLIGKPVAAGTGRVNVYLTDLDGVSSSVRMGTTDYAAIQDGSVTSSGQVVITTGVGTLAGFSATGTHLGGLGANSLTIAPDGSGQNVAYAYGSLIHTTAFPSFATDHQVLRAGTPTWIRWSPVATKLVYADGGSIWTVNTDGSANQKVIGNGTYPTFDSSGTRIFFSRIGDGIYVKDLTSGSESRVAQISGTWSGRIVWH